MHTIHGRLPGEDSCQWTQVKQIEKVRNQVWDQVRNQVWNQGWYQVWYQVWYQAQEQIKARNEPD